MTLERPNQLKRCPGFDSDMMEPNRTITLVPKRHREFLSDKAVIDYYEFRKPFLTYLLRMGKNPEKAKGYSPYTVCNTASRTARFDYWVWQNRGGYKIPPDEEDAKAYMEKVAYRDVTDSTKGKNQEAPPSILEVASTQVQQGPMGVQLELQIGWWEQRSP